MSDTPLTDAKEKDGEQSGGMVEADFARQLERALAAAIKERDESLRVITTLEELDSSSCDTINDLRAQLSALQSATPQDHAQVIEEVAELVYTRFLARDALGCDWPWKKGGNSIMQDEARQLARALVSTILTPQPRKEGDEPCAQNHARCAVDIRSSDTSARNAPNSNRSEPHPLRITSRAVVSFCRVRFAAAKPITEKLRKARTSAVNSSNAPTQCVGVAPA